MRKKITKVLAAIFAICAVLSFIVIKKISLDKPVFIKNYREMQIPEVDEYGYKFEIFYITSAFEKDKVSKVTFKEMPNIEFLAYDYEANPDKYGINKVHLVNLYSADFVYIDEIDRTVLKNASIEFSNGSVIEADLGEIYLYKKSEDDESIDVLSYKSSSDGSSSVEFKVNDNVQITGVYSPYLDMVENIFDYNIYALGYSEDEGAFCEQEKESVLIEPYITFSSQYKCKDLISQFTYYDIRPKVYLHASDNYVYSFRTYEMSNRSEICYANNRDLYKYLKIIEEV